MVSLFVIFLILSGYSYLIYPCLLWVLSRILKRDWAKRKITPAVSVIISAYNEEAVIDQKVRNALALDYPEGRLEVIVSSDGSTDGTNEIVSSIKDPRLILFAFPERKGKTAYLNRVVPEAKGEIILFTDANSMFPSDLLINTARNFASQDIGLVTGWTKYHKPGEDEEATSLYSRFEQWCKKHESILSSCVGADGAVFAIKKALFKPLQDFDINDFVIPLDVIRQGKRVVLDPDVFCHEDASGGNANEYERQVRITTRTLGAMWRNMEFLNPIKYGYFSFLLLSHKVMRFTVPLFAIAALVVNGFLLGESPIFLFTLLVGLSFILWGLAGLSFKLEGRFSRIFSFVLLTWAAQLVAWVRMLRGAEDVIWTPQR